MSRMKKFAALLLAFLLACSGLSGCAGQVPGNGEEQPDKKGEPSSSGMEESLPASGNSAEKLVSPAYPQATAFEDYDARQKLREENPVEEGFIDAVSAFAYESAAQFLTGSENANYSPVSLYLTLAIAASGAGGNSQEEILQALNAGDKGIDDVSRQSGNLFRLLFADNEVEKLKIASSLWLGNTVSWKEAFLQKAETDGMASVYRVDFQSPDTAKAMGEWVAENTNQTIQPQIQPVENQILSIMNTVYLKAEWVDRFDEAATKPGAFTKADGGSVTCDFMNSSYDSRSFAKGDGYTAASLSLKGQGSVVFVLPDEGVSPEMLLQDPQKAEAMFQMENPASGKVIFSIPKFDFTSKIDLKDGLRALGIKQAFEEDADFSGMTDQTAFISSAIQQSQITMNENGVEAAAFTELGYAGAGAPQDLETVEMILNRPFLYAVMGTENIPIFIGICGDPTKN